MSIKDLYADLLEQPLNHDIQETDSEIIARISPKLEKEVKALITKIDKNEFKKTVGKLGNNYNPAVRITIQSNTTWKIEVGVALRETNGCWEFYCLNSAPFNALTYKKISKDSLNELFPNEDRHLNITLTLDKRTRATFYFN